MAIIGLHSLAALLLATLSLAIVSAAIALPQWLRGYYGLAYCYLGLFKISIGNEYGDVAKYLPQFEGKVHYMFICYSKIFQQKIPGIRLCRYFFVYYLSSLEKQNKTKR